MGIEQTTSMERHTNEVVMTMGWILFFITIGRCGSYSIIFPDIGWNSFLACDDEDQIRAVAGKSSLGHSEEELAPTSWHNIHGETERCKTWRKKHVFQLSGWLGRRVKYWEITAVLVNDEHLGRCSWPGVSSSLSMDLSLLFCLFAAWSCQVIGFGIGYEYHFRKHYLRCLLCADVIIMTRLINTALTLGSSVSIESWDNIECLHGKPPGSW